MRCLFGSTLILLCIATATRGGILSDLLTLDGRDNVFEDNSRGLIYDQDNDGELSSGDVITGLVRLDRRISPTASSSMDDSKQLIVAYSFEVDQVTALGGGAFSTIQYEVTSPATGLDIQSLLGDSFEPAGFADWDKAAMVVMERIFGADNSANNPVSNTVAAGASLIDNVLGDGSGYSLDAILGFASNDDFYSQLITGAAGVDISDIQSSDGSMTLATQSGGFTALYSDLGPGATVFRPVEATDVTDGSMSLHDVGLEGGIVFGNNETNWDFADKANVRLNVVPEPATLSLVGLLGGCLAFVRWRKSRI